MADIEYIVSKTHEAPDLAKREERLKAYEKKIELTETQIDLIDWSDQTFFFPDGSQMTADEQDLYFDFMWHPEKYEGLIPQTVEYADTYKLPDNGQIAMSQIRAEVSGSGQCSLNDAAFRGLISKSSGQQQAMSEYYGKSSGPDPNWASYDVEISGGTQASSDSSNSYGTFYYVYTYGGQATVYDDGGYSFSSYQHGGYNYTSASFPNEGAGGCKQTSDGGWWPRKDKSEAKNYRHYRNGVQLTKATGTWKDETNNPLRYWCLNIGGYNSVQNPTTYRATHKT